MAEVVLETFQTNIRFLNQDLGRRLLSVVNLN